MLPSNLEPRFHKYYAKNHYKTQTTEHFLDQKKKSYRKVLAEKSGLKEVQRHVRKLQDSQGKRDDLTSSLKCWIESQEICQCGQKGTAVSLWGRVSLEYGMKVINNWKLSRDRIISHQEARHWTGDQYLFSSLYIYSDRQQHKKQDFSRTLCTEA